MKLNFAHIYEGWRNKLFPPARLKELISSASDERKQICDQCSLNSKNVKGWHLYTHCTICKCPLLALRKCLSCDCEAGYWHAVISFEEEQLLRYGKKNSESNESSS